MGGLITTQEGFAWIDEPVRTPIQRTGDGRTSSGCGRAKRLTSDIPKDRIWIKKLRLVGRRTCKKSYWPVSLMVI